MCCEYGPWFSQIRADQSFATTSSNFRQILMKFRQFSNQMSSILIIFHQILSFFSDEILSILYNEILPIFHLNFFLILTKFHQIIDENQPKKEKVKASRRMTPNEAFLNYDFIHHSVPLFIIAFELFARPGVNPIKLFPSEILRFFVISWSVCSQTSIEICGLFLASFSSLV
jgi:hypothetical protein